MISPVRLDQPAPSLQIRRCLHDNGVTSRLRDQRRYVTAQVVHHRELDEKYDKVHLQTRLSRLFTTVCLNLSQYRVLPVNLS